MKPTRRDFLHSSVSLKNCRNVVLRDFAISHGGHFGILQFNHAGQEKL